MILHVFIPGIPQNANSSKQWARFKAAANRKKFRKLAADEAKSALGEVEWTASDFTTISARHVSPYVRKRDPLGLAERLKPIMDGLVDANIIPDDDEKHIAIELQKSIKGDVAGIQLVIRQDDHDEETTRPKWNT